MLAVVVTSASSPSNGGCDADSRDAAAAHIEEDVVVQLVGKKGCSRGKAWRSPSGSYEKYRCLDDGHEYSPGDAVYIESQRADQPYFICTIQEFRKSKSNTLMVNIKWFYRPCEIPETVYQLLVQDRNTEHSSGDIPLLLDPSVRARELFISDAADTYPVSFLRGTCRVHHYQDVYSIREFVPRKDTFFYILGYNPETGRLASTQGEIRVGPSHQARLPEFQANVLPVAMLEKCEDREEVRWRPGFTLDSDLLMYLRAARSVAAFAGMCDNGSPDEGCLVASRDDTTINALDTLHSNSYDPGKALQALLKCPLPKGIDKKWTEEETKRFVKGLRQYGKNFFAIRKNLLSSKETTDLVEFYYLWKKTPGAASFRPHRRHRRQNVLRRIRAVRATRSHKENPGDLSSASEEDDTDDSDSRDMSGYHCRHCCTTSSKDWHHAGKNKVLLCTDCRLHFKKYGELPAKMPPFVFCPVEATAPEEDSGMRTRTRSRELVGPPPTRRAGTRSHPGRSQQLSQKRASSSSDTPDTDVPVLNGHSKSPSTVSSASSSSDDKAKRKDGEEDEDEDGEDEDDVAEEEEEEEEEDEDEDDDDDEEEEEGRNEEAGERKVAPPEAKDDLLLAKKRKLGHDGGAEEDDEERQVSAVVPEEDRESPSDSEGSMDERIAASGPLAAASCLVQTEPQDPVKPEPPPSPPVSSTFAPEESAPLPPCVSIPVDPSVSASCIPLLGSFGPPEMLPTSVKDVPPPPPPVPCTDSSGGGNGGGDEEDAEREELSNSSNGPSATPQTKVMMAECHGPKSEEATLLPTAHSLPPYPPYPFGFVPFAPPVPLAPPPPCHLPAPVTPGLSLDLDTEVRAPGPSLYVSSKSLPPLQPPLRCSPDLYKVPSMQTSVTVASFASSSGHHGSEEGGFPHVEERDEEAPSPCSHAPCGPSPEPRVEDVECHRSQSAIFLRHWNRGDCNSCARTDMTFKPVPDSKLARKRDEKSRKQADREREEREKAAAAAAKKKEIEKREVVVKPESVPILERALPPRSCPGFSEVPVLRQISEYMRPHGGLSPNVVRSGMMFPRAGFDHNLHFPLGFYGDSRTWLELEHMEREKREREFRDLNDRIKAELEMKTGISQGAAGPRLLDPHWLELHRRFGIPLGIGLPSALPTIQPSPFPFFPSGNVSQHLQGQLERERLGISPAGPLPSDSSLERLHAERMAFAPDPMLRLQMNTFSPEIHSHSHAHAHAHTHLHLHTASEVNPGFQIPGYRPSLIPSREHAPLSSVHPSVAGLLGRSFDEQFAHQLTAQAQAEQLQRHILMERDRFPPSLLGAQLQPQFLTSPEEFVRQQQEMKVRALEEAARNSRS